MPIRSSARLVPFFVLAGILSLPAFAADPLSELARSLAGDLGFEASDITKLEGGGVVVRQFQREAENELAVILASKIDAPASTLGERARSLDPLKSDKTIKAWGRLEGKITAASFAKLELPADELGKLAGDDAGKEFNFSQEEQALLAARLAGVASAGKREAAMAAYREILAGRATAYQAKGIAGIAPYQRGRKQATPGQYLKQALPVKGGVVQQHAPDFHTWLQGYPGGGGKISNEQFVWLLQELNGRPGVILAHRAQSEGQTLDLFVQRDYYVGHTFDVLQVLTGVVPSGDRSSVIFYTNRTFTEQVAGFGSSAAHAIGRKIMIGEITTLLEAVKASLAKP